MKDLQDVSQNSNVEVPVCKNTPEHALSNLPTGTHTLIVHALLAKIVLRILEPPDLRTGWDTRKEEEAGDSNGKTDATIFHNVSQQTRQQEKGPQTHR